jgi:hypothetical protein
MSAILDDTSTLLALLALLLTASQLSGQSQACVLCLVRSNAMPSLLTSWRLRHGYESCHPTTETLNFKIYKVYKVYKIDSNLAFHILRVTRPLRDPYEPAHATTETLKYKILKNFKIHKFYKFYNFFKFIKVSKSLQNFQILFKYCFSHLDRYPTLTRRLWTTSHDHRDPQV